MSTTGTATTADALPTGTWNIEPAHSSANFSVRHLGLSKVRGHFEKVEGTLELADDPTQSSINVTIDAGSIQTNQPDRDGHLKSADFLDVENHPVLEFRSTRIAKESDEDWIVEGELTVHGVTRPVTLDVEYLGTAQDPMGAGQRIAFEAETKIVRHDFGLTWEGPKDAGGILVGRKVDIDIDVEFVQAQ
ncbi:MAG TPA: YceI family protein [Euzebyales bacterium]